MTRRALPLELRGLASMALVLGGLTGCAAHASRRPEVVQQVVHEERQPEKLLERGKAFAQRGDLTRAAEYLTAALDAGASEAEVLPLLMRVYVENGAYRLAIERGEEYLQLHPNDARMRYLVATMFIAIEEPDRAIAHLRRVTEHAPGHADAHFAVAVLLRDAKSDWVRADYHFRQYLALEPSGQHAAEARANLLQSVP